MQMHLNACTSQVQSSHCAFQHDLCIHYVFEALMLPITTRMASPESVGQQGWRFPGTHVCALHCAKTAQPESQRSCRKTDTQLSRSNLTDQMKPIPAAAILQTIKNPFQLWRSCKISRKPLQPSLHVQGLCCLTCIRQSCSEWRLLTASQDLSALHLAITGQYIFSELIAWKRQTCKILSGMV